MTSCLKKTEIFRNNSKVVLFICQKRVSKLKRFKMRVLVISSIIFTWFFLRLALNEARRDVFSRVTGTGNGDRGDIIWRNEEKHNISKLNVLIVQSLVHLYTVALFRFL